MECESKISDNLEAMKDKLYAIKIPSKQNLRNINEFLDLFDRTTTALLNPIKKLKISYNMRINSIKGKYENFLSDLTTKISALEKNKNQKELKDVENFTSEELTNKSLEFTNEHSRLTNLLEDCLESISTLNNLFETQEFRKLDEMTKKLTHSRKSSKSGIKIKYKWSKSQYMV